MVIRTDTGELLWQDPATGDVVPYDGQDGAVPAGTTAPVLPSTSQPGPGDPGFTGGGQNTPAEVAAGGGTSPSTGFDPTQHVITNTRKVPGGTQIQYKDSNGDTQVTFVPDKSVVPGGTAAAGAKATGGGTTAAVAQRSAAADASLAEQQRQFNENMGMHKAEYNQNYAFNQGKELLGLGSRPDTLIKYLYAIRGQQTPQAVAGTTTNLPGFQNVVGQPNPGGAAAPAAQPAAAPVGIQAPRLAPLPTLAGADLRGMIGTPQSATAQVNAQRANNNPTPNPVDGAITPANPYGSAGGTPLTSDTANFFSHLASLGIFGGPPAPTGGLQSTPEPQPVAMAAGGVIPEPVIGYGLHSGQTYTFGERGPETVVPGQGAAPKGDGSYAAGGTIGYDPSVPGPSANVFNPPDLQGVVARGYNSSPQTPLFPQIGIATNGGQSLIPSAQRLNSLLPSEQSLYSGALTDEFGVQPDDVFAMTRRLAPQVSGLRTPRFAN